jgi:hypothetical protein
MAQYDQDVISILRQRNAPLTHRNYNSMLEQVAAHPELRPSNGKSVAEPSPSDKMYDGGLDELDLGPDAPKASKSASSGGKRNTGQQKSAPASTPGLSGAAALEGGTPGARAIGPSAVAQKDSKDQLNDPMLLLIPAAAGAAVGGAAYANRNRGGTSSPRVEPAGPAVPGAGSAPRGANDNAAFNPPAADEFAMQRQNAMDGEIIPPERGMQRSSVSGAIDQMLEGEATHIDPNAPQIEKQGASVKPNVQGAARAMVADDIRRVDDSIGMPRTTGEVVLPDTPKAITDTGGVEPRVVPGAGPQRSVVPNPDNAPGGVADIRSGQVTPNVGGKLADRMDLRQLQQAAQAAKAKGNAGEYARVNREITALLKLMKGIRR